MYYIGDMETMNTQIARNVTDWQDKAVILARQDGQRVRFEFPDRAAAFKAHKRMLKAGADYLDTNEDGKTFRWINAPVIR